MIDKIKFCVNDFKISKEDLKSFRNYGKAKANENIEVYVKYLANNNHKLALKLAYDLRFNNHRLYIEGSLRKWYYGKHNIQDFNFKDFTECIYLLSKSLNIETNKLWNSKVTKLETGITLRFKKEDEGIVFCISRYKRFKKNIYETKGVKFKGKNYNLIFYDKMREIYNDKEKLERNYRKITKNNFLFRYEIQGQKVSGMDMFKSKANTLLKVKNNWKYLGQNLISTLDTVEFIDVISPQMYMNLKGGSITEISEFLIYKGMKSINIENTRMLIEELNPKKRSDCRKKVKRIYEKHLDQEKRNYEAIFRQTVEKKVISICRK